MLGYAFSCLKANTCIIIIIIVPLFIQCIMIDIVCESDGLINIFTFDLYETLLDGSWRRPYYAYEETDVMGPIQLTQAL